MTAYLHGTNGVIFPDSTSLASRNDLFAYRNKIINGGMDISQRGTSFAAAASGSYSLDRWQFGNASAGVVTITQQADAPSSNEFQNSLRVAVTTADTSIAAGDLAVITQSIEGYNVRDLIGKTFTLSFWVRSSKTGTHCVAFRNNTSGSPDRAWIAEYTINAANTWEQKTITVSGGLITAGTWNWTTGAGLGVSFTLAAGSTYQTTAGAWQTGSYVATANQVNCLDSNTNIFAVTGVQLEIGSVATPFEHRPYGMELALCQRYYYRAKPTVDAQNYGVGLCTSTTTLNFVVPFPVVLRTAPTSLEQTGTATDYRILYGGSVQQTCSSVPVLSIASERGSEVIFTVAAVLTLGQAAMGRGVSTNGYLGWSAEL